MKWSIGAKIASGFGLALAILIIIGVVTYDTTAKLIDSAGWVEHTHRVLAELEGVLSTLTDAETGQRGYLITGEDRYLEPYTRAIGSINQKLEDLRQLTADNPNQQRRLDVIESLIAERLAELKLMIDLRRSKGLEAALPIVLLDKGKATMDEIRKSVASMEREENELLKQRSEEEKARTQRTKATILFGTLLSFALLATVAFVITQNISKPLRALSDAAQKIAVGDLAIDLSSDGRRDEVHVLTDSFMRMTRSLQGMAQVAEQIAGGNLVVEVKPQSERDVVGKAFTIMKENLRRITGEIQEAVNVLASSASEIVAATSQVSSTAAETAAAISETTTTVEEVKQTTQTSGQKAKYVSEGAQKSANASKLGKQAADETLQAMNRIREQMSSIAETVVRLSEQGQAIAEIIATVNDLSEQSNLLAVNAAIEAAKAGEQGRGFSVVAQEVKSLAEQSKQATTQVRSILNDIQKATSAAVMATEQGSKAVEAGVKQATQAGESVQALAETIATSAEAAFQITASQQQVLAGVDQVVLAMESIKQASTQNVAGTQQASTAAHNLQSLGQKLKQLVEHYRV